MLKNCSLSTKSPRLEGQDEYQKKNWHKIMIVFLTNNSKEMFLVLKRIVLLGGFF